MWFVLNLVVVLLFFHLVNLDINRISNIRHHPFPFLIMC
jgi:hypothetical protein